MDARDWDKKIEQALNQGTRVDPETRENVWNNIESRLYTGDGKESTSHMKRKRNFIRLAASVAAIVILVAGLNTQPGLALVNRIRELFDPEKNITQDIEGTPEERNVKLNEGKDAEYVIYVDEERYGFVRGEDADRIVPNPPLEERYPEVSMEIRQVNDKKPEALIEEIQAKLQQEFSDVTAPEKVDQPVSGWTFRGLEGGKWDSRLVRVYVIDNRKEGSFVITQRYFLEAEEGHGARFDHMLREFYIVEEQAE